MPLYVAEYRGGVLATSQASSRTDNKSWGFALHPAGWRPSMLLQVEQGVDALLLSAQTVYILEAPIYSRQCATGRCS